MSINVTGAITSKFACVCVLCVTIFSFSPTQSKVYTRTPTFYLDFRLQRGATHVQPVPSGRRLVCEGEFWGKPYSDFILRLA